MMRFSRLFSLVWMVSLVGCSTLQPLSAAPNSLRTDPAQPPDLPTSTRLPPVPYFSPPAPLRLRLWVPPFLDPTSEEPAGSLLNKHLTEFQTNHPDWVVEIRVKSVYGTGGLLDSLTTANAAAPAALPDLVALPRDLEEAAALKGLLLPLDNLTTSLDGPDWYPYAAELAHLQDNLYGFPFAGDALVQIYSSTQITRPVKSWTEVIDSRQPLLFPAASDSPLFTLAEYQANGGILRDEQGRPALDPIRLSQVLSFIQQARQSGAMPPDLLTQLQNDDQAWTAFRENQGLIVITFSSRFLSQVEQGFVISQIPTPLGKSFTLATGWVWSLVGRDEEKRPQAVKLAEFLVDSQFLADWSQSAGFLPTRPSSLSLWSQPEFQQTVGSISFSAHLFPPTEILSTLELPLQQATLSVLKGQTDPTVAAQSAAASLTSP